MIIDGGRCEVGLESTIIDLTEGKPVILRPGYITQEMLENALQRDVAWDRAIIDANCKTAPRAPGMKYRHYAPKADLTIIEGNTESVLAKINELGAEDLAAGKRVGVIATDETRMGYSTNFNIKSAGQKGNEIDAAKYLFQILREFDDEETDVIYSESFEGKGVGQATMNRLLKAAGHKIISI